MGEKVQFLSQRCRRKTRAKRDVRGVRERRRCACENQPSVFGKSLHHVAVRESGWTLARVGTGLGTSVGSASEEFEGAGPCIAEVATPAFVIPRPGVQVRVLCSQARHPGSRTGPWWRASFWAAQAQ